MTCTSLQQPKEVLFQNSGDSDRYRFPSQRQNRASRMMIGMGTPSSQSNTERPMGKASSFAGLTALSPWSSARRLLLEVDPKISCWRLLGMVEPPLLRTQGRITDR
jgi:hypothetical protein